MASDERWVAVVPVKLLAVAKSRLGLADAVRQELALAMACDVVAACLGVPAVAATVVVTNDARAAAALVGLGAVVVADGSDAGLNPALVDGARHAEGWYPRCGVVAVSSDLAALEADAMSSLLSEAAAFDRAVVTDSAGTGTTVLTARAGVALDPCFGPGSRNRHVMQGAVELDLARWPQARRDVDTLADLAAAAALGLGAHTTELVSRLGLLTGSGR